MLSVEPQTCNMSGQHTPSCFVRVNCVKGWAPQSMSNHLPVNSDKFEKKFDLQV